MATQQSITKELANKEIKKFLKIKDETQKPEFLNQLSPEARTYIATKKVSFVVYKDQLDDMFDAATDANAIRIYCAAKESGDPSFVLFACKVSAYEDTVENRLPTDRAPGTEHTLAYETKQNGDNFDAGKE